MTDLPIVCTLSAEGLRARKQGLLAQVARRATCMTKILAGYRFEFEAESDTLSLIATMIDAERQCCRFLQFELSVGPDLGPLTLTLHVQIETERLRIKANGTLNVFDLISHAPEPHNQRHR